MAALGLVLFLPASAQATIVDADVIDVTGHGLAPMVLSPDGATLAVASWGSREVFLIDTTTQDAQCGCVTSEY